MISMTKKYRTRGGSNATILCVDARLLHTHDIVALVHGDDSDIIITYPSSGTVGGTLDLIEIGPYDDWEIDDHVLVKDERDGSSDYRRRHYAGKHINGKPTTWPNGMTSFTTNHEEPIIWDEAKKYDK